MMSTNVTPNTFPQYPPAGPLPVQPGYRWDVIAPAYPFASFGKRLLAQIVDAAVCAAILLVPVALGVVAIVSSVGTDASGDVTRVTHGGLLTLGIAAIVLGVVGFLLYEPLLTARKGAGNGQTIGKRVAGVRIVNLQGGPISTGQAWGRALFKAFFSDKLFYLGYLWMLWDARKQTWHDKVASTFVLDA
jgi:uncharacterized RDD family membrane protein YckC